MSVTQQTDQVLIGGRYCDDDGWEQDLGPVDPYGAWWLVPLPACPDCGGDLVWYEAGYVPGTRRCMGRPVRFVDGRPEYDTDGGCGSLFHVFGRDGRVFIRRERLCGAT